MVIVGGKVVASGCFPTHKESLAKVFRLGVSVHYAKRVVENMNSKRAAVYAYI